MPSFELDNLGRLASPARLIPAHRLRAVQPIPLPCPPKPGAKGMGFLMALGRLGVQPWSGSINRRIAGSSSASIPC